MVDQHKLAIASGELDKMPPLGMFYHHFYIPDSTVYVNVELTYSGRGKFMPQHLCKLF